MSPAHCAAVGPGLIEAAAGSPARFQITPRDSFGNPRPLEAPDTFTVSLARKESSSGGSSDESSDDDLQIEEGTPCTSSDIHVCIH